MSSLLPKILYKSNNRWLPWGAGIGAFVGLLMLLLSVQLMLDIRSLANTSLNFVTINKQITVLNTVFSAAGVDGTSISAAEVEDLRKQPFVKRLSPFVSNQFKASLASEPLNFSTYLFMQSLPNEYLDVDTFDFRWSEGQEEVPFVLNKNYLSLYNFAFAPSQPGLPTITEDGLNKFVFDLYCYNPGKFKRYKARVVGLTERVNSVLVPESFLKYNNAVIGDGKVKSSQIMLEVDNAFGSDFQGYLADKGFEKSTSLGDRLKASSNILTPILVFLGLMLTGLSLLVFLLNFRLQVSDASADIRLLSQIGYPLDAVKKILRTRFLRVMAAVLCAVAISLFGLKWLFGNMATSNGLEISSLVHPMVWMAFAGLGAALIMLNLRALNQSLGKLA